MALVVGSPSVRAHDETPQPLPWSTLDHDALRGLATRRELGASGFAAEFVGQVRDRIRWMQEYAARPAETSRPPPTWTPSEDILFLAAIVETRHKLAPSRDYATALAAAQRVEARDSMASQALGLMRAALGDRDGEVCEALRLMLLDARSSGPLVAKVMKVGAPCWGLVNLPRLLELVDHKDSYLVDAAAPPGSRFMSVTKRTYPVREAAAKVLASLGVNLTSERVPDPELPDREGSEFSHFVVHVNRQSVADLLGRAIGAGGDEAKAALDAARVVLYIEIDDALDRLPADVQERNAAVLKEVRDDRAKGKRR